MSDISEALKTIRSSCVVGKDMNEPAVPLAFLTILEDMHRHVAAANITVPFTEPRVIEAHGTWIKESTP